jgi:hypothetical protein
MANAVLEKDEICHHKGLTMKEIQQVSIRLKKYSRTRMLK